LHLDAFPSQTQFAQSPTGSSDLVPYLSDMEYSLRLECLMCSCVFAFSAKLSVTWASGYVLFVIVFYGLQVVLQRKAGQLIQGAHKVINIISNVF